MKKIFSAALFLSLGLVLIALFIAPSSCKAFAADQASSDQTYVVVNDVVFLRSDPTVPLPAETKSLYELEQLDTDDKMIIGTKYYYGENLTGTVDQSSPVCIRIKNEDGSTKGYIDITKLWKEDPAVSPAVSNIYLCKKEKVIVHLLPDENSRQVLGLIKGEVVDVVGMGKYKDKEWIKAGFDQERFGYIKAEDVQALIRGKVDSSALTIEEIPYAIRSNWNFDSALGDTYKSFDKFSDGERRFLSEKGFYIEELTSKDYQLYIDDMADKYRKEKHLFITSDLFLHSFHLVFDRMLQDTEEKKLLPKMGKLSKDLAKEAEKEYKKNKNIGSKKMKSALLYNVFYFSVAAKLFDPGFPLPPIVEADASSMVQKIMNPDGPLPSLADNTLDIPIDREDFTQYKARGHYEKNDSLKQYFRGMMWYGRRSFLLKDGQKTLSAILMAKLVKTSGKLDELQELDSKLGFLIGKVDDFTVQDYLKVNKAVFGSETPDVGKLTKNTDAQIQKYQAAVVKMLPAPKIVSMQTGLGKTQEERIIMTTGFKLLGQRFTWDSYIFSQLTSPSVGTDNNPRNLPTALDVMMLLGSDAAKIEQDKSQQENKWENYDSQTVKLTTEFSGKLETKETFYDNWLYVLNSLFAPTGSTQLFALGKPWQYKNLNSSLGSWTELKHDTLLYSEQNYAEMGGGASFSVPKYIVPGPKGYVEPNPVFFGKFAGLCDKILIGLKGSDFITDEYADKFTTLKDLAEGAQKIAEKEIKDEPILREDYAQIGAYGKAFDEYLILPAGTGNPTQDNLQMALIVDVATDAVSGLVLEEAIGVPQKITVVVKDAYGGTRITIGYVYSWYEFPSNKRMTDTEWKKLVYSVDETDVNKLSGLEPKWYKIFRK